MRLTNIASIVAISAFALVAGCSSANKTVITGSWDNPDHSVSSFDKILILGISENQSSRAVVEQSVADELGTAGFTAVTAIQNFTQAELDVMRDNQDLAKERLAEIGVDAVLVMSVLDIKEETYYVPGTTSYHPTMSYPYYGGYYGYWGRTYTTVSSPGYYEESVSIFLEINVYDLDTDELVWSAQSKTQDPSSVQALSTNFSRVLVDEMVKSKAITPS
jgi:hypothetical protein